MSNSRRGLFGKVKNWSKANGHTNVEQDGKPSPCEEFYNKHQKVIRINFYLLLIGAFFAFLIAGLILNFPKTLPLLIITVTVIGYLIYAYIRDNYGGAIYNAVFKPILNFVDEKWWILKWLVYLGILAFLVFWLIFDTGRQPERLISFAGLVMYVLLCYIFSKNRQKVYWRQVLWGIGLQFILGILILRTHAGYTVFNFIGSQVEAFLSYTFAGAAFVFGEKTFTNHYFAFAVLPIVVFFSATIAVLYYLGVMKWIITRIAWLMQITMKTSATESLNAAGNIFIGQTEAPLLIRPFIQYMTVSELHAVMTGGMATIAGSVLGAFIAFGVPAAHLLTASVMSAPAALAISKLMYPELEKDIENLDGDLDINIADSTEGNIIEAASGGASASIPLVANIAANIIAFLSALKFLNAVLGWLGAMVNYPQLSFEIICSYVFMPFAFMMGVEWKDAHRVAELIGMKTFLNEFIAYDALSKLIKNRLQCEGPYMSLRSEVIATYACCGFSNIGSIGILLGGLTPMAPNRRGDLARIAVRALISATIACFMTACLAGKNFSC
ncbi:uncharacterized protein TRIADDRAFT_24504 [Trichoplax adhaerens]|uniref:Sodium/nucleoside cotransporter n=1 Tax=Trichoplax adhaerens TaxID=10228 RepID=B3RUU1_TRIAD|nr:hypothetical protein TRIADDRAFT_24504 [Trichoplax adhaerens]EDV25380.1 hypothetical protein TRIADDRAFT_24504 [Trichoplax adhaerens]|eukprot:XP_002111413.1 hypothetical protein TRIADDRAFT_24504 [Trichoplax adhaerens]